MATQKEIFKNAFFFFFWTLSFIAETAFSQNCDRTGCTNNLCCGSWGYCGSTTPYCGTGCQTGPCTSKPAPNSGASTGLNAGPRGTIAGLVTPELFNSMMSKAVGSACPAKGFYTRAAFIEAALSFEAYKRLVTKRELAAMLAQFSHETGGFCYKEATTKGKFCSPSTTYPCQPGKNYYGRGPIQITWNYNYGAAGKFLGLPLLKDPDMVARNSTVAFKFAMWFWDQNVRPVISKGFGATTRKINSSECKGGSPAAVNSRAKLYLEFCTKLGVTEGYYLKC